MKIKVYVIELSSVGRRNTVVGGAFAMLAAMSLPADAAVPHVFGAGDPLSAAAMNQNFGDLDARLVALETFTESGTKVVENRNGKKYSLGATYCGQTANQTGNLGGYSGAKTLCENLASCGVSPSAHMCTAEEVVRSRQLGIGVSVTATGAWYSTGTYAAQTVNVDDCSGWLSATSSDKATVWRNGGGADFSGTATCDLSVPVLCCD